MYRPGWKRVVPWLMAAFVLLASPAHAFAAEGDFSLGDVPHLLPGGVALGTVANLHETTSRFNGTGPCTSVSVEHTWVVIGFRGPASDPKSFIIHDPSGRARQTVSASAFYAFTRYFKTGVVVRG